MGQCVSQIADDMYEAKRVKDENDLLERELGNHYFHMGLIKIDSHYSYISNKSYILHHGKS